MLKALARERARKSPLSTSFCWRWKSVEIWRSMPLCFLFLLASLLLVSIPLHFAVCRVREAEREREFEGENELKVCYGYISLN